MNEKKVSITPETKVAELLEAYPQLEEVLIEQAPAFKNLKNPILRKTVAKVASLEMAARVAGIKVRDLVSTLRRASGAPEETSGSAESRSSGEITGNEAAAAAGDPGWLDGSLIRADWNADALIAAGDAPLARAAKLLQALRPGEIIRIASSFEPAPLIEVFEKGGHRIFCRKTLDGSYETFIAKGGS